MRQGMLSNGLRDLAVGSGALSLWGAAETWHAVTGLWLAQAVAVIDGVLAGAVVAFLLHEWGHFAGALLSRAEITVKAPTKRALLVFDYDYHANDSRQFRWMTLGGHVGHWGALILLIIAVPMGSLSSVVLVSTAFGFVVFASVIEVPVLKDTWSGADPQQRLSQLSGGTLRHSAVVGILGAVFAVAALS